MTASIGAGFKALWYGITDDEGYLVGGAAAAVAGDTEGSPMVRLETARVIDPVVPEPVTVDVDFDDDAGVSFTFPAASTPRGALEIAAQNLPFEALAQQTKVETIGDLEVGVRQPSGVTPRSLCLYQQRIAKEWIAGQRGHKKWQGLFYPNAELTPTGAAFRNKEFVAERYIVSTSKTDRKPWGDLFSTADNGTLAAPVIPIHSDYPLHWHPFLGNGTQDAFLLDYTPVSAAKVYVWVEGVKKDLTTHYTVNLGTATVTFTVGNIPAASARIIIGIEVAENVLFAAA
jgi:hypothetical protein